MTADDTDDTVDGTRQEIFASASWPSTGPIAPLWESSVVFADGPPDRETATSFISAAVERHRLSAEAFAEALLADAGREHLDQVTVELQESIVDLGLARAILTTGSEVGQGEDDGWRIGFAGYAEYADGILPPLFELPVSLPLAIDLLGTDDTTVRARDIHVYSDGLLVTVDVAVTRAHEMPPEERFELEQDLSDVTDDPEDPEDPPRLESSRLLAASARATAHACVAQWDYWVPIDRIDDGLQLRNPLRRGDGSWHLAVDLEQIEAARSRVVDLR